MPKTFYPNNTRNILLNEIYKKLTDKMAGKINPPQSPSEELNLLYAIWEVIDSLTNGATTNIVTGKTYLQISADKAANKLIPGAFYLIPDYRTYQFIPGTDVLNTSSAQYVSTLEPLIVFALSTNQFAPDAYSLLYPTDHIIYDFDATTETSTGPMPVTKTDKPGSITRRISGNGLDAPYDWRACLFRRAKISDLSASAATWDGTKYNVNVSPVVLPGAAVEGQRFVVKFTNTNTAANPTIVVTDGVTTYVAKSLKTDTRANYGIGGVTANSYGFLIYETATNSYLFTDVTTYIDDLKTDYWSHILTGDLKIGNGLTFTVNPLDFTDYYTFDNKDGGSWRKIEIDQYRNAMGVFEYNNIVIKGSNNNCYDVTIHANCKNLTLSGNFSGAGMNNVEFYSNCLNHIHTFPLKDSQINTNFHYGVSPGIGCQDCLTVKSWCFNLYGGGYNVTIFSPALTSVRMDVAYMANTTLIGSFDGTYDVIEDCIISEAGWNRIHMIGFLKNKSIVGTGVGLFADSILQSRSDSVEVINYSGFGINLSI